MNKFRDSFVITMGAGLQSSKSDLLAILSGTLVEKQFKFQRVPNLILS